MCLGCNSSTNKTCREFNEIVQEKRIDEETHKKWQQKPANVHNSNSKHSQHTLEESTKSGKAVKHTTKTTHIQKRDARTETLQTGGVVDTKAQQRRNC